MVPSGLDSVPPPDDAAAVIARLWERVALECQRAARAEAIAARLGCATSQAFDLLRAYSRSNNRRLAEVAGNVVDGQLPAGNLTITGKAARHAVGHSAPLRER